MLTIRIKRLGLLLEAYRALHPMSQEELGQLIGVCTRTINGWEKTKGDGKAVSIQSARKLEKIGIGIKTS